MTSSLEASRGGNRLFYNFNRPSFLCSQFENIVSKHHEVHQAIGGLNMPLKREIILPCQKIHKFN